MEVIFCRSTPCTLRHGKGGGGGGEGGGGGGIAILNGTSETASPAASDFKSI